MGREFERPNYLVCMQRIHRRRKVLVRTSCSLRMRKRSRSSDFSLWSWSCRMRCRMGELFLEFGFTYPFTFPSKFYLNMSF
jgi:hypothetical protein